MKITLNLAGRLSFRERYGLTLGVPALVVLVVVALLLAHSISSSYREHASLVGQIHQLETRQAELADQARRLQSTLRLPQTVGTRRQVQFVNSLIGSKRLSLSDLTLKLAALLPPDVRLSNLTMLRSGNESELRFQLAGRNEEALAAFMKNLQDSPDFADPGFSNQGSEQEQNGGPGEITLACQTRYIGLVQPAASRGSRRK